MINNTHKYVRCEDFSASLRSYFKIYEIKKSDIPNEYTYIKTMELTKTKQNKPKAKNKKQDKNNTNKNKQKNKTYNHTIQKF